MKCIIIEDEANAARHLTTLLGEIDQAIEVITRISSVKKAIEWLSVNTCDLIFMDVQLEDDISFSIFEQVKVDTSIIFTTAYDEYAIQAFKVNSVDYLLKPVSETTLKVALDKYNKYKAVKPDYGKLIDYKTTYQKRFLAQTGEKIKTIFAEDIAYFYVQGQFLFIITKDNCRYLLNSRMETIEPRLDPDEFFRINRQFIISIHAINNMQNYSRKRMKIITDPPSKEEMIVSVERADEFRTWLNR